MKLLHFADAHIDMANYGKHDPETGLPLRVLDFLKSLDTIVDAAISEKVDMVIFGRQTIDTSTGLTTAQTARVLGWPQLTYVGKIVDKAPTINMTGMQNALDEVAKTIPAAKNAKPEQFVDMRFLDKLEKSGLLAELYK